MYETISTDELTPGITVHAGYDHHGKLIIENTYIESDKDIQELRRLGVTTVDVLENRQGNKQPMDVTLDNSADEKQEASETEPLLDDSLESITEYIDKTQPLYERTLDDMKKNLTKLKEDPEGFNPGAVFRGQLSTFIDYAHDSPESLMALTRMRRYDEVTFQHSLNVALLSILYGRYRDFDDESLLQISLGALMHDVGKLEIEQEILQKPDSLSDEEWEQIKEHPLKGKKVAQKMNAPDVVKEIIADHHKRPDGSGYPDNGHSGSDGLSTYAQIVSVIDVYEALTARRPYSDSKPPNEAFDILKAEFDDYDSTRAILRGLIYALGVYPVGAFVRLTTDEVGVVQEINPQQPDRPTVLVLIDRDGELLKRSQRLDLEKLQHQTRMINGTIFDDNTKVETVMRAETLPFDNETLHEKIRQFER